MALKQYTYAKGPEGAAYAIADDGAILKTGASNGPIIYTADTKPRGGFTLKASRSTANGVLVRYAAVGNILAVSVWLKASAPGQALTLTTGSDGNIVRIEHRADTGVWAMVTAPGVAYLMGSSSADSPLNTWNRFEFSVEINATTAAAGKLIARRFNVAGAQVGATVNLTNANLGTVAAGRLNVGPQASGTAGDSVQWYDLQFDEGSTTIPAPLVDAAPPANPRIPVGILGDSTANQAGTGEAAYDSAFGILGWAAADVRTSGVNSRVPWGNDVTPSTETSLNAWLAEGFDPKLLVLVLGANIRNSQQSTWEFQFTQLFNKIDDGTRRIFALNLAFQNPAEGQAFNTWFATWLQGKPRAELVDKNALIRAREQAGQTVSWNADGIHMLPGATGYDLVNNLTAQRVAAYVDTPQTAAPVITAVSDRSVAAGATVSTTVAASNSPTSYAWRQVSGPAVTLSGSGSTRTFTAPDQTSASTVVLGVTATNSVGTSAERTVTVNVAARTAAVVQNIYKTVTFDDVPAGTALSLANSGLSIQGATAGNTATASATGKVHGANGGRFNRPSGGNVAGVFGRHTPAAPHGPFQLDVYWTGDTGTASPRGLIQLSGTVNGSAGARLLQVLRNANNGIYTLDRNNSAPGDLLPAASIVDGKVYRLTFWGDTTTGEYHARAYDFATGNPVGFARDVSAAALGGVPISQMDFGSYNDVDGTTLMDTIRIGDRMVEPSAYTFTESAPTVNDLSAVSADSKQALSITASALGSVTSWAWRQISGATAALTTSGPTVSLTTPATQDGTTVVLGVRATNATGQSVEKTVTITVAAHVWWKLAANNALQAVKVANSWVGGPAPVEDTPAITSQSMTYTASTDQIANPDRGWFNYSETRFDTVSGGGFTPLVAADLAAARTGSRSVLGGTISNSTVVFRYYIMSYMRSVDTIPEAFLTLLSGDFAAARQAGVKLMPRFVYSNDDSGRAANGESGPYNTDTTPARTIGHVNQLKATIDANADVIHAVQLGFIGTWGEQYYSDNWGARGILTQQNWDDRARLLTAILGWDSRVKILVRYPGLKFRYMREGSGNGWTVPAGAGARIGFHNDGFLAPFEDYGTFTTFPDGQTVEQLKAYVQAEAAAGLPVTGESASAAGEGGANTTYAQAKARMSAEHWNTLNPNYRADVLNTWSQADKDEIGRLLGYRLRLTSAELPLSGQTSETVPVVLRISNDGWGVPTTARKIQLLFVNGSTVLTRAINRDVQTLTSGANVVTANVILPTIAGTYTMHLAFPDPSLPTRPEYAIQLANGLPWASGRNALGATVVVS